jgi:tetratricopeptide (TPR) repeat protein
MNGTRMWIQRLLLTSAFFCVGWLIVPVQNRLDASLAHAATDPDLLYFSSPSLVKSLALGYDGLMADLYWMRTVQYYGRRDEAAQRKIPYKNLAALLDIVTTLDPDMVDVYRAGSIFLAESDPVGAGQPAEAIRLLDKGILSLPQDWRLPFDKGFIYFWYVKDYRQAGQAWLAASRIDGSPKWLEALAARGLSQGGAVETAKSLWRRQLEEATRADLKANAANHLASIQVDEDRWTLEYFLAKYAAAHGSFPARLDALVMERYLQFVPKDPSGVEYSYDSAGGTIRLSPASKVRYLKLPYDYEPTFKARLARISGSQR